MFHPLIWQFLHWDTGFWNLENWRVKVLVTQSCLTLCDPMDYSPPSSSVHGIVQVRILEWVAIPFSRISFQPSNRTQGSCIEGRFFTIWDTREPLVMMAQDKNKMTVQPFLDYWQSMNIVQTTKYESSPLLVNVIAKYDFSLVVFPLSR